MLLWEISVTGDTLCLPSRTIQSEVDTKKKDEDPQYSTTIKQQLADFEAAAKKEMENENRVVKGAKASPTRKKSKAEKKKKTKKKDQKLKRRVKPASESSYQSNASEGDEPDEDDSQDSASEVRAEPPPKKPKRTRGKEERKQDLHD